MAMAEESRERRLTEAFVSLADTLVAGYDTVDLLQRLVDTSADVLDASAAGLLLADESGELAVLASTSEESRLVELMQLHSGLGPCVEAYVSGEFVTVTDIDSDDRWPDFNAAARGQGFRSLHAIPMRLRATVIGTLNLFRSEPGELGDDDTSVARGLADIATIGILHERAVRENDIAREELQRALNSRVIIEQAKGVLAQLHSVDMDASFRLLRDYSRNHGVPLRDVAEQVVRRVLSL
ncbi:MAG: transcriptional regulator [Rhodoglobus sp.]|nr:transcriptional regulator [Rhodoglobus sp.]